MKIVWRISPHTVEGFPVLLEPQQYIKHLLHSTLFKSAEFCLCLLLLGCFYESMLGIITGVFISICLLRLRKNKKREKKYARVEILRILIPLMTLIFLVLNSKYH
jgi:hypothetical protein